MKKLVFVMVAAFSLMFVSCNTTPAETSSSFSDSTIVKVDSTATEVPENAAVKPSKPEGKENVDVTTPAKPTEEANKPVGNKK
jgi:hypothetical protein